MSNNLSAVRGFRPLTLLNSQNLRHVVGLGLSVERVERADHPIHGGGVEQRLATTQPVKGLRG